MGVWDFVRDPASARLLVEFGRQRGVSEAQLLRRTGLKRAQLDDPQATVEATQELHLITNLLKALKQPPLLGWEVGLRYGFTTYGIWGYGLISSATLGDALQLALRFLPLTYAFTLISVGQVDEQIVLKLGEPEVDDGLKDFLVQRDMAAAARLIAEIAGPHFQISRILLTTAPVPMDQASALGSSTWGAKVEFGAHMNAIMIDSALLQTPLPNANALTAAMCQQLCMGMVERRRSRQGMAMLVRSYLQASCGNAVPDLGTMAKQLYVSERTLKRRLQAEGTSFRQILAEVRSQLAQDLLAEGALSVNEIAARLGFGDASSFSQAFKRWHGVAPSLQRSGPQGR